MDGVNKSYVKKNKICTIASNRFFSFTFFIDFGPIIL